MWQLVGTLVAAAVGALVGAFVGLCVGLLVGALVGLVGAFVGEVGVAVGVAEGVPVFGGAGSGPRVPEMRLRLTDQEIPSETPFLRMHVLLAMS